MRRPLVVACALLLALTGCTVEASTNPPTMAPDDGVATSTPVDGAVALWELAPGQNLNESTTSLAILVTRLECNSGVTGSVNPPAVTVTDESIIITATVSPVASGVASCQGNDQVAHQLDLPEPLGDRRLIDGACADPEAGGTVFCETDERYAP